ncbi:MAG: alpha/beta fold hydrolase [Polyangiaceae bacterium]|jgi:pimeloyl-ACP methyl ester carboxylesterase
MRAFDGRRAPSTDTLVASTSPRTTIATPWTHHFVSIEDVDLHWAECGESTGKPPLLLLHGLNDCYLTWRHLAPLLAVDRRVLVPDLPGHGLSGRPDASYALRWYAHIMGRWCDRLSLDRLDVVGHSFGGGVAQVLLLECPGRLRRLVLVSSGGLGREITPALRLATVPFVVERLGQPFMEIGTRLALKATGDVLSKEEIAMLSAMNAQRGSARAFGRTVRDIIDWRGQRHTFFDHAAELSQLPPIAVFWGDHDRVIPSVHAQGLAEAVEGIRLVTFEGCGHYPHHEEPGRFFTELHGFLDDAAAPNARLREVRSEKPTSLRSTWRPPSQLAPVRPPEIPTPDLGGTIANVGRSVERTSMVAAR